METSLPSTAPLPHRPNLDGLRFIMCLGIAVFHLGPYFFGRGHDAILKFDYFTDVFLSCPPICSPARRKRPYGQKRDISDF